MTEEEARGWIASTFDVSRETRGLLEAYVAILLEEMRNQNLIAESTRDQVWTRHIADSAQLIRLLPQPEQGRNHWIDLGAGAGLPGVVAAILTGYRVTMIEVRRKRVNFLEAVVERLGLTNAHVIGGKVELAKRVHGEPAARVISARAYAPMERLIASALHLTDFSTIWVLPKGANYENELDIARRLWHCTTRVEPSLTAPDSAIIVLEKVRARRGKRGS